MSDDLISREDTKQAIRHKFKTLAERCEINEVLNSMPSVQPKTGWWKHVEIETDTGYFTLPLCECSVCDIYVEQESNYCPHCGAKMEGEAK